MAEIGTRGQFGALIGDVAWLRLVDSRLMDDLGETPDARDTNLLERARSVRAEADATIGLAVVTHDTGPDTDVGVAIVGDGREHVAHHTVFLGGANGRHRAALSSASELLLFLRADLDRPS